MSEVNKENDKQVLHFISSQYLNIYPSLSCGSSVFFNTSRRKLKARMNEQKNTIAIFDGGAHCQRKFMVVIHHNVFILTVWCDAGGEVMCVCVCASVIRSQKSDYIHRTYHSQYVRFILLYTLSCSLPLAHLQKCIHGIDKAKIKSFFLGENAFNFHDALKNETEGGEDDSLYLPFTCLSFQCWWPQCGVVLCNYMPTKLQSPSIHFSLPEERLRLKKKIPSW